MLRVRVTTLESFRRYIKEVSTFDTEAALIEKLEGKFTGNDKTRIGEALHDIIENGIKNCIPEPVAPPDAAGVTKIQGWEVGEHKIIMNPDQVALGIRYRQRYPAMVHEVPLYKVYTVPRLGQVLVTGKMDGICGRRLHDRKVSFKSVDCEEYMDSYQWRYYLDMVGVNEFQYDFFEVKGWDPEKPRDLRSALIVEQEPLTLYDYLGLGGDCHDLVVEFLEYIHYKNFYHLLKTSEIADYENTLF